LTATTSSNKQKLVPLLTTGRYFRQKFGVSVFKVPVSIMGFTCPNIDGTAARGGCIFCENESFSPNIGVVTPPKRFRMNFQTKNNPYLDFQLRQLEEQVAETKSKLIHKFKAQKFLIYFQSFTNTYAPFPTLKALYEKALSFEDTIGLSIGTRTDAISDELLDYLQMKAKEYEIWVEYGVQSCHDVTLKAINRGHDFKNVKEGIKRTKERGLKVCAHVIFGLPGENEEMMLETIRQCVALKIDAIKIHPLYVTKRTALAKKYKQGLFEPIDEWSYIEILIKALKILPRNIVIQRVTAGIDDESLLAPEWCRDFKRQKHLITLELEKAGFDY
jgi:radical SAM protein (TIGR01212 family)